MNDLTRESDRILSEGKSLVRDNREGGRHRRAPSIGQGSARVKRNNWMKRVTYFVGAVFAIFVSASIAGLVLDGSVLPESWQWRWRSLSPHGCSPTTPR